MKVTLSVIKADIGGVVRHSDSHPDILDLTVKCTGKAKKSGLLIDCYVTKCGDDLRLIVNHEPGEENGKAIFRVSFPRRVVFSAIRFLLLLIELGVIIFGINNLS